MFACKIRRIPFQRVQCVKRRNFAVKELSWCADKNSPKRAAPKARNPVVEDKPPIDAFGIVAAISRNRVIGVDGSLPWNLPQDRKAFTDLTKNKILIVGRRTFEERENQSHISHVAQCIVVSRTLPDDFFAASNHLQLARSFPAALALAKELAGELQSEESDEISCWVGGGERIYNEAVLHPSARKLHLTIVDMDVDVTKGQIARFPVKYRWDNKFKVETENEMIEGRGDEALSFTQYEFKRLRGRR